jgi:DNA repair exonuclease SbcCD ATPase subunit
MSESNILTHEKIFEKFKELEKKLEQFSSILEKFGLDIITKMGQTNLKITQLIDKVTELHNTTLDVKSLTPQLSNVIVNQKDLEREVELLKSLIINLEFTIPKGKPIEKMIERNETATNKKDSIISQLNNFKSELATMESSKDAISVLEKIKEEIFEFTGGHRILYEISQAINRLNTIKSLSDLYNKSNPNNGTMEEYLNEKITFWINKLMVKD